MNEKTMVEKLKELNEKGLILDFTDFGDTYDFIVSNKEFGHKIVGKMRNEGFAIEVWDYGEFLSVEIFKGD